jgi:hypothetical protein
VAKRLPKVVACAATLLRSEAGQPGQRRDDPVAHQLEGRADLQLLDVLGQVARGHPLVDVLVPGEGAELLDACLHVVAGDPLAGSDRGQVDPVHDRAVVLQHAVRHVDAQVALRLEDGDPELPLEDDLVLRRPEPDQLGRGVAVRQHVRDAHGPTPAAMSVRCRLPRITISSTPA